MYDFSGDAQDVADCIAEFGNPVTLADGQLITAIVDVDPENIRRAASDAVIDLAAGQEIAIFIVTPADYAKIEQNAGASLLHLGVYWSINGLPKNEAFGGVSYSRRLTCIAGGNPN